MLQGLGAVQKTGFVVQGEDDAVQLEQHLIGLNIGLQLALLQKYRETVRNENSHLDTVFFTGITAGF